MRDLMNRGRWFKLTAGLTLVLALVATYWILRESNALETLLDGAQLRDQITRLGVWGPVAVVALMTLAILVSPIPSAPIAMAAGAVYGHWWGTLYVLVGSEVGAIAAFWIARLLGRATLHRWFGEKLEVGLFGSQNALTGIVFVTRLMPFISFDIVSYAAGLTVLKFWRFALATLAGIVPASFLLAHFGGALIAGEAEGILLAVLLLGLITGVPILVKVMRDRLRR
jgi:uncharacterized membrane protein YdjX (TVP38/TMEM64 family)